MKELLKAVMAHTPYRLVRDRGANRFQAIEVCLRALSERGFSPKVVIDGGAHLGAFSLVAKTMFPQARFHLIEPQPACSAHLSRTCVENGFVFHECALADKSGRGFLTGTVEPDTGAHMLPGLHADSIPVVTTSLDDLFGSSIHKDDRALLKLDLQGYELFALRGGTTLLSSVELILLEVSFFAQAYEPSVVDLLAFLDANGFILYDIAALAGRTRDNRLKQGDFVFARKGSALLQDGRWE